MFNKYYYQFCGFILGFNLGADVCPKVKIPAWFVTCHIVLLMFKVNSIFMHCKLETVGVFSVKGLE